jgi:NTE family protein
MAMDNGRKDLGLDGVNLVSIIRNKIARLPLFDGLRARELDLLAEQLEWLCIPGGRELFREGDPGDALFVVVAGRLAVVTADAEGRQTTINQIGVGETVGEMALVTGELRSATIIAMRDTELLRLEKPAFERLTDDNPGVLRFITKLLVHRLHQMSHRSTATASCTTVALVPLGRGIDVGEFTREIADALARLQLRIFVADRRHADRPTEWFNALEEDHDIVLYQAEFDSSEWTRLCIRQADRIVMLTSATHPPTEPAPALSVLPEAGRGEQIEIVFLHAAGSPKAVEIDEMLTRHGVGFHYHVRENNREDVARVARLISGRAVGIVFSGGGARGFAHIGVIRAFRAAGIQLDMFGGTSMGSMIAAAAAMEWSEDEALEHIRAAFVLTNPLSDYTLPLVAVVRGRKVSRLLREHLGEALIEECWRPFFCTSSNLTSGQSKVHRSGPLWRAIRASIAIPGVLPPVIEGNQILIDGGVINNLPVDVMSAMRRGRVVGVDVAREHVLTANTEDLEASSLWQLLSAKRRGTPNIIGLLMSAGTVNSEAQLKLRRQQVDILIEPVLDGIGMLDWKSYDKAIEEGYRQTMEILEHAGDRLTAA